MDWDWVVSAFWLCLAVGAIYTIVSFIMGGIVDLGGGDGHVGGGDFSHEYGVGGDGGYGGALGAQFDGGAVVFSPLSPMVIAFFLTCFGGTGLLLTELGGVGVAISLPVAAVSGFVLAWLMVMIFNRVIGSVQASSEVRLHTLIGLEAEVTVDIPSMGVGEVAYVAMGSRSVAPARSEDQTPIIRFSAVRISRIVGNMLYVRPLVEEQLRNMTPDVEDAPEPSPAISEND